MKRLVAANGEVIIKELPEEEPAQNFNTLLQEAVMVVQNHLDITANTRGYDSILAACTYATSSVPKFAAEGQACVLWRDAVWASCYVILGEVQAGTRLPPTIPELLAQLPTMTWPVV